MKTETKLTIDDMIRRAVDDRLYMEGFDESDGLTCPPPIKFLPGTALSHGIRSVEKQSGEEEAGIFWLLTAIATWVAMRPEDISSEVSGFDEDGLDQIAYANLQGLSDSMEHAQFFTLQKWGELGAELCVSDGNCEMRPIQRFDFTNFPWGEGPFSVWVFRERVGRSRVWTLMLPAEY
jgi:hypothetical protein